jgi:hypothetical protein
MIAKNGSSSARRVLERGAPAGGSYLVARYPLRYPLSIADQYVRYNIRRLFRRIYKSVHGNEE